jgi:hypothetical protein
MELKKTETWKFDKGTRLDKTMAVMSEDNRFIAEVDDVKTGRRIAKLPELEQAGRDALLALEGHVHMFDTTSTSGLLPPCTRCTVMRKLKALLK